MRIPPEDIHTLAKYIQEDKKLRSSKFDTDAVAIIKKKDIV